MGAGKILSHVGATGDDDTSSVCLASTLHGHFVSVTLQETLMSNPERLTDWLVDGNQLMALKSNQFKELFKCKIP